MEFQEAIPLDLWLKVSAALQRQRELFVGGVLRRKCFRSFISILFPDYLSPQINQENNYSISKDACKTKECYWNCQYFFKLIQACQGQINLKQIIRRRHYIFPVEENPPLWSLIS